jgi:ketosteroid isomerase-like protein
MNTEQAIRDWLLEMQSCVRALDYDRAEKIFAPEAFGFGTYASIARGRETLRREQWSHIWHTIRDFTFTLDEMSWGADGNLAWVACSWTSTGFRDGHPFDRPGRMTTIFKKDGERWLAIHTHFSLYPMTDSG